MCTDPHRQDDVLCVVEEPFNISSIEKTGIFRGRYHVLLGSLSPLKGMGPDELRLEKLVHRLETGHFKEIIVATNPTVDGEATALYLLKILKISREADPAGHGAPRGIGSRFRGPGHDKKGIRGTDGPQGLESSVVRFRC
jgi:recombination protein RecR